MAGTIAQSPLSAPTGAGGGGLRCELATAADDARLRALLRRAPMEGRIALTLEREPDFFAAAALDGNRHYTACVRDARSGALIGMGSRTVRERFVNGAPVRLGYLSQLRIDPAHRSRARTLLRAGFHRLRQTRAADEAPFDITTIIADNTAARRLLAAGLPGLPRYTPVERILTMLLPVRGGRARPPGAPSGTTTADGPAVHPHQHNAGRYQFAPVWTDAELSEMDVIHAGEGGCLARWDQRAFKQAVVRGYSPWLRRCRWLLGLPAPGTVLPLAHLVPFAINDDAPAAFLELLDETLAAAQRQTDCRWLVLGLAARHPLSEPVRRRYRPRVYESMLYVVHEPGTVVELDGRIAHPEVALL